MDKAILISLTFGILLTALILALIFGNEFRKDIIAESTNSVSLGPFSVQGVLILALIAIFALGIAFPHTSLWAKTESDSVNCDDCKKTGASLEKDIKRPDQNKTTEQDKTQPNIKKETKELTGEDVLKYIRNLRSNEEISTRIRDMVHSNEGPWNFHKSAEVIVSVPGNIDKNEACPDWINKSLKIASNGNTLEITIEKKMWGANCKKDLGYDIKLTNEVAEQLISLDNPEFIKNKKFTAKVIEK